MPGQYEYTRPTVSSNGCAYATLDSYNQNYWGRAGIVGPPVMSQGQSMETVVIPSYGGIGYNTLAYNQNNLSCSGYYNVKSAYPSYPNACGRFSAQQCGLNPQ